jgi:hypothetical protein
MHRNAGQQAAVKMDAKVQSDYSRENKDSSANDEPMPSNGN